MKNYDFATHFRSLFDKATEQYAKGQRGAESFFSAEDKAWLAGNGLTAQNLYDYAEDENNAHEPGYDRTLGIELIRRDYFLLEQGGKPSKTVLDEAKLPAKTDSILGIEWLPRIIPKARAKLRGELPPSLMYCCGGDRRFFKTHDILPSEFLAVVWKFEGNDPAVVDWVVNRSSSTKGV
jgi:hypothetical protein